MLSGYCNQVVGWKSKTGQNEYNEPIYASSVSINVRFEYKRRLVRNKQGQEVVSEARVFTEYPLKPDDLITYDSRDWPVISVSNLADLDGQITGYEVSL